MTDTKTLALVAEVERLTRELAEAKRDADLYRWLKPRMMGADFDWNESGAICLVFEMPPDTRFSADCDKTIAAAKQGTDAAATTRKILLGIDGDAGR